MNDPGWLSLIAAIVLLLAVGYLSIVFVRRVWLSSRGGLFDCGLRSRDSGRWRLGLARYSGERFEWYLLWKIWPRPTRVFVRSECELGGLRETDAAESRLGYAFSRVLSLRVYGPTPEVPAQEWDLALNEGSAMGLVSWLEAAPPGQGDYLRRH